MSEIYEIADGVVAVLNGSSLTPAFEAVRVYQPLDDLEEVDDLTVLVVPHDDDINKLSRDSNLENVSIDVGVFQHLPEGVDPSTPAANAHIDPLVKLCRAMALLFGAETRIQDSLWVRTKYAPIFDADLLKSSRIFFGLINVTFKQAASMPGA